MKIFVLFVLIVIATSKEETPEEDVEDFLSSFEFIIERSLIPPFLLRNYTIFDLTEFREELIPFANLLTDHIKNRGTPFGLTALKRIIERITEKLKLIDARIWLMNYHVKDQMKVEEFKKGVQSRIRSFLSRFDGLLGNNSAEEIDSMKDYCFIYNDGIPSKLVQLADSCINKTLDHDAESIITNVIDVHKFEKYTLSETRATEYRHHYSNVYQHLVNAKEYYRQKINTFILETNGYHEDKAVLLRDLVKFLGIEEGAAEENCFPILAFVASHYDQYPIETLNNIVRSQLFYTEIISQFCARVAHPDSALKQQDYMLHIEGKYPRIDELITEWINATLESTWPRKEMELIRQLIIEYNWGNNIDETPKKYAEVLLHLERNMNSIGNPFFKRNYIMTKYDPKEEKLDSTMHCKENHCAQTEVCRVVCMVMRADISSNNIYGKVLDLVAHRKALKPVLSEAMDRYDRDDLKNVISQLSQNKNINILSFANYSSMAIIRNYEILHGCQTSYSLKTGTTASATFIQTMDYRYNEEEEDCEAFTFFFGI